MISVVGYMSGDIATSKIAVLDTIKENIPTLAPWIYKSISKIIEDQLNSSTGFNIINIWHDHI